jgi:peptidyl-prolyl cis-trans isomerase SurA
MNVIRRIYLLAFLLGLWAQGHAQEAATGQVLDKIVGKVDNNIVLESEVQKTYIEALSQAQQGIEAPTDQ